MLTYNAEKIRGPKALINYFFDKVNLKGAIIVILISLIVELLFYLVLKVPSFGMVALYTIYSQILVSWLLTGFILYLIVYFVKGKSKIVKNLYSKILSSLASLRIPLIIYMVFTYMIILFFVPEIVTYLQNVFTNPAIFTSATSLPVFSTVNVIGLTLVFIGTLFIFGYLLVMLYFLAKKIFNTKTIISTILYLLLIIVINSFINFVFL